MSLSFELSHEFELNTLDLITIDSKLTKNESLNSKQTQNELLNSNSDSRLTNKLSFELSIELSIEFKLKTQTHFFLSFHV